MPRKEYSFEIRDEAEELYIEQGLTHEEVTEKTGVPVPTIKIWSTKGGWKERRKEYLEAKRTLRQNMARLRQNMVEKAAGNLDPQSIYAVARLEKLALQREKKPEGQAPDIDRPKVFLEDMEFVAETLKEIDPEGLKIFARNFETIVDRFKEKHNQDADKRR